MSLRTPLFILIALLGGLASGCASEKVYVVDDELVAELGPEARASVRRARDRQVDAAEAVVQAKGGLRRAADALTLARADRATRGAELERARLGRDVAQKSGTSSELESAQALLSLSEATFGRVEAEVEWREAALEHAERRLTVAQAEDELAVAELELEKAVAVRGLDRPAAREVVVGNFEKQVEARRASVAKARKQLAAASDDVALARRSYEALLPAEEDDSEADPPG